MGARGNALHQWEAFTLLADQGIAHRLGPWAHIKEIVIFFNNAKSY